MSVADRVVLVSPETSLQDTLTAMASAEVDLFGIAVVVDHSMRFHGLLTDGDVLRLLARNTPTTDRVSQHMNTRAVTAQQGESEESIIRRSALPPRRSLQRRRRRLRYVPILDDGRIVDVVDVLDLVAANPWDAANVDVIGLGHVGITLAVALASRGLHVTGIEQDEDLVQELASARTRIAEPRLDALLASTLDSGNLTITDNSTVGAADAHIIAVGTPLGADGRVDLADLLGAVADVGRRLQPNSVVCLRSTVSVGTTRAKVKPLLEDLSGLTAGVDFHLAFTPERTIEGDALRELSALPQIIGGLTPTCAQVAGNLWSELADSLVFVDTLEAAELVKLINNSFRDHIFGFANALALLADEFNVDATRLIAWANEGYPRDRIPSPSPGVGGYCLTKDPLLYAASGSSTAHGNLARSARSVNTRVENYPVACLTRWATIIGRPLSDLTVLVAGLAFKGIPETDDVRGSSALATLQMVANLGCQVQAYDAVIPSEALTKMGLTAVDLLEASRQADALLILNNHPDNAPDGLVARLTGRPALLFDGWKLLDRHEAERVPGLTYAAMGYMTPTNEASCLHR